jgi:hypothetical protein
MSGRAENRNGKKIEVKKEGTKVLAARNRDTSSMAQKKTQKRY